MKLLPSRLLALAALTATVFTAPIQAQLRPSVSAEVLTQWSNRGTGFINPGWWHGAALLSTPIVQGSRLAWVGTAQVAGQLTGRGEDATCSGDPCRGPMDVAPRGALLTGAAFIGAPATVRLQVGVARYEREWEGTKHAPQVRLDADLLPRRRVGLVLAVSHAWLGDYRSESVAMSAFGVGLRYRM